MKQQNFLTYDRQIALLKQQGMVISDENRAKEILAEIGYYELINGYKRIFKADENGNYRKGTRFEDITALYKCDENLRELCLKYMLRIEIHIRALLSYAFCETYGTDQSAYLDRANYSTDRECARELNHLISELDYGANRADKAVYVRHQREHYQNVPLWVLIKTLSLGTLLRFYRCSARGIRIRVAEAFPDLREETLYRMLDVMQDFRNVCAHNDCLYSYRSTVSIPAMPALRSVSLQTFREGKPYEGCDLFALFVIFRYLLNDADFRRAAEGIDRILMHFESVCGSVNAAEMLSAMGFPEDWKALSL